MMQLEMEKDTTETGSGVPGNDTRKYVTWKDHQIQVPTWQYWAGTEIKNYTPKKILDTLEFYYKHLKEDNLHEVRMEELEDHHFKGLLKVPLDEAIKDTETDPDPKINKILIELRDYRKTECFKAGQDY